MIMRKNEFKYYDVYIIINDYSKFMSGYECGGPKRTKLNYTGGDAFDLNTHREGLLAQICQKEVIHEPKNYQELC